MHIAKMLSRRPNKLNTNTKSINIEPNDDSLHTLFIIILLFECVTVLRTCNRIRIKFSGHNNYRTNEKVSTKIINLKIAMYLNACRSRNLSENPM